MDGQRSLIELYFGLGFSQIEILACLAINHGIIISQRHLRRLLRKCDLRRRRNQTSLLDVAVFIEEQLRTSCGLYGYRWMHSRCIQEGLVVTQSTVRTVQQLLDPEGIAARKRNRLIRRKYRSNGPNQTWHMDGYDKLKPFGIAISGCIDGFSRNIIWLEAFTTNNDPKLILTYYLDAVSSRHGCPRRIRADMGTENCRVEQAQRFLRRNGYDSMAGENSFLYGTSTTNQRMEAWWSFLRKHCSQYWMDILHTLKEDGLFSGDQLDKNLIQLCFMRLVQDDLDQVAHAWNTHRMRSDRKYNRGGGRPMLLYTLSGLQGIEDELVEVDMQDVAAWRNESRPKGNSPCDPDIFEVSCILMEENDWVAPTDGYEAAVMYTRVRQTIRRDLGLM